MKQNIKTYSGAEYTVTDNRLVEGGSKHLKEGILMNPPVQINKSMLISAPERVPIRDMPPPAPGVIPAVSSSDVVSIKTPIGPNLVHTLKNLVGIRQ